MKITAIGMVKNAADVIEACIRGNSWLIDQFVLLDNMSSDRTVEILQALQAEGFKIEILDDNEIQYRQSEKMDRLCAYACEKYPSDFIIPIDDDEIIIPENETISMDYIKDTLRNLDRDALYYAPWRVYFPTEYDDNAEINVAKRQLCCFSSDTVLTYHKVIIPTQIVQEEGFHIMEGNHGAESSKAHADVVLPDLRFAHFPIRSEEQIKSKALIGYTNLLTIPDKEKNTGFHWGVIYKQVRDGNPLTIELLQSLSTLYLHPDADIEVMKSPVPLSEDYMQMKYTRPQEVNALKNYCLNVEALAAKYAALVKKTQ